MNAKALFSVCVEGFINWKISLYNSMLLTLSSTQDLCYSEKQMVGSGGEASDVVIGAYQIIEEVEVKAYRNPIVYHINSSFC